MLKILFYAAGEDAALWLAALRQALPTADCRHWQPGFDPHWQADYALVWKPPAELFIGQQQLRAVINLGAGVDALLKLPTRPAVALLKLRDAGMADSMLDYIRYGLLHFMRDFDRYIDLQRYRQWQPVAVSERSAWPIGVLGTGAIGAAVAQRLAAEGYVVSSWSRSAKQIAGVNGYAGREQLDEFLAGCRVLINLLPGTPETLHLIGAAQLAALQADAVLISCGRGEVIDQQGLVEQLNLGVLRGALLDVFDVEPLPEDSPLWSHPGVIVTPHISAPTPIAGAVTQVVGYINALEAGEPVSAVDPERGY